MKDNQPISVFVHIDANTPDAKPTVAIKAHGSRPWALRHLTATEARELAQQLNRAAASVADSNVVCT